jgi:hypothetical protein
MDEIIALAEKCGFVRGVTSTNGRPYFAYKRNVVMFGRELVKRVNELHAEINNERKKHERTI